MPIKQTVLFSLTCIKHNSVFFDSWKKTLKYVPIITLLKGNLISPIPVIILGIRD